MGFSFENQGTTAYLVYTLSQEDTVDDNGLKILSDNAVPGLASAVMSQQDEAKCIKYSLSGRQPVKQFFEGQVNKSLLLGVLNGIVRAICSAEEYGIDLNTIFWDPNFVFADESTYETIMICLPLERQEAQADISGFFKAVVSDIRFDPTENWDYIARITNYLNGTQTFSFTGFKALLGSLGGVATSTQPQVAQPQADNIQPQAPEMPVASTEPVQPPEAQTPPQPSVEPIPEQPPQPAPQAQPVIPMPQQPVGSMPQQPVQAPPPVPSSPYPEKQLSVLDLLMHYNKENKALYDAQKKARKAAKGRQAANAVPSQGTPQDFQAGFGTPGVPTNAGAVSDAPPRTEFAAPQEPPVGGFAVPEASGQPAFQQNEIPQQPQIPVPQAAAQPVPPPVVQAPDSVAFTPAAYALSDEQKEEYANFGETTVLGNDIGETTVLGSESLASLEQPYLIREKNQERINLDKPVFRIGKEKSYVDYFVADNTAISRSHCNIISRDGSYFIVDTNSTNHTYVNGGMIQSNVETALSHGAKIRLANETFEFKLY